MIRAFFTTWSAFFLCAILFTAGHTHITDEEITLAAARSLAWPDHSVAAVNDLLLAAPPLPDLHLRPYHYGLLPLLGTAATLRWLVPIPSLLVSLARESSLLFACLLIPAIVTGLFWFCYHQPQRVTHLPRAERHSPPRLRRMAAVAAGSLLTLLLLVAGCLWLPLFLLPALLFGLTAACLHHYALRAGLSPRRALAMALLVCACSSLLVWSDTIKDEVYLTAALAGTLTAYAAARPRLAALTLALAILAKPASLVACLFLAGAAPERKHRVLALLALAATTAVVVTGNVARFGTMHGYQPLLATGVPQNFSFPVSLGLAGHLFSPLRSIFVYNPFLLLVVPVIIRRLRARTVSRLETCALLGAFAYLLLISAWTGWEGEVGYANRLALPVVLLAAVMLPQALRMLSRPAIIGIGLLGLLVNLPGSAWDYANWYQMPEQQRELVQEIRPQPLAPAAFTQTGTMFALACRALFLDLPRQHNYVPAEPTAYLPLEYHFWLNKPDLWPVYLAYTSGGARVFAAPGALAAAFLPWLALLALCLLLLRRLWHFSPSV